MAARWFPIRTEAHTALTDSTAYAGPRITITDQLAPAVWPQVKTVLEKLGAVYIIGSSAFEFETDQDAHAIVTRALAAGRVMAASQAEGYVATPPELAAYLVAQYAELSAPAGRRLRVLEPSAGNGRFVTAITHDDGTPDALPFGPPEWLDVTAVEPDPRRARQIPTAGGTVTVCVETFEVFAARALTYGTTFDVIVMNPPFAVPGSTYLWAEHLLTAWKLLAPGGRLLAILPASVLPRTDGAGRGLVEQVRTLVYTHGGSEALARDEFAESGITVSTAAVWLDRPPVEIDGAEPTQPIARQWVSRTYTGDETPLPVRRPYFTRTAAAAAPVQTWHDGWRNADRILRYRGECHECTRPVWGFDDGENDPRGALGDSAVSALDPGEYGEPEALSVVLCFGCANDGPSYGRALDAARVYWREVDAQRTTAVTSAPAVFVSSWGSVGRRSLVLAG